MLLHSGARENARKRSDVALYLSDVKKMPLGKLSKVQIAKGFEVSLHELPVSRH